MTLIPGPCAEKWLSEKADAVKKERSNTCIVGEVIQKTQHFLKISQKQSHCQNKRPNHGY